MDPINKYYYFDKSSGICSQWALKEGPTKISALEILKDLDLYAQQFLDSENESKSKLKRIKQKAKEITDGYHSNSKWISKQLKIYYATQGLFGFQNKEDQINEINYRIQNYKNDRSRLFTILSTEMILKILVHSDMTSVLRFGQVDKESHEISNRMVEIVGKRFKCPEDQLYHSYVSYLIRGIEELVKHKKLVILNGQSTLQAMMLEQIKVPLGQSALLNVLHYLLIGFKNQYVDEDENIRAIIEASENNWINCARLMAAHLSLEQIEKNGLIYRAFSLAAGKILLQVLLERGVDLNKVTTKCKSYNGNSPLSFAINSGSELVLNWLFNHGVAPVCPYNRPYVDNPLKLIQTLVSNGLSINAKNPEHGTTLLDWACSLHNGEPAINWLCKQGVNVSEGHPLHCLFSREVMPYQSFLKSNLFKTFDWLRKKGADIQKRDASGQSLLDLACSNGDMPFIQWLCKNGFSIDKDDPSPLIAAIKAKEFKIAKWLLDQGINPNGKKDRYTILETAASSQSVMVELLCLYGANPSEGVPLHMAAKAKKLNIIKFLIEEKGVELNTLDENGHTPLDVAIQKMAAMDVIDYLSKKGAKISGQLKAIHFDFNCGFDFDAETILALNEFLNLTKIVGADISNSNLLLSALKDIEDEAEEDIALDLIKFMLEKKFNIQCEDKYGRTPLDIACEKSLEKIVKLFCQSGADLSKGHPLLFAVYSGKMEIVKFLIDKKEIQSQINLKVKTKIGSFHVNLTPLELAFIAGNVKIAKCLLEHGADPYIGNAFYLAVVSITGIEKSTWHFAQEMVSFIKEVFKINLD